MSYNKFNANMDNKRRSKKERERAAELKLLERAGVINNLNEQVRFLLVDTQYNKRGEKLENKAEYIADFTYWENGRFIVEDVKGYKKGPAWELYVLKRKLMLKNYGIRIRET